MKIDQNNYPLISVIVNCYNGETFLRDSIKSILNQSYKNFEIIFWDHQSSDQSASIYKNFKHKRLKYYYAKRHTPLYEARNLAIKRSRGKYIAFLDTDDLWKKNFLKEHIRIIKRFNPYIVYSKYYIKNDNKGIIYLKEKKDLFSGHITQNLLNNYSVGISAVVIKKNIFNKYKFNNNLNIIGDFDFFIRLSLKYKFFALNKALVFYRFHLENLTYKNSLLYYSEFKQWYKDNFELIKKFNLNNLKYFIFKLRCKHYFQIFKLIKLRIYSY